jgi:hypothetical protein
MISRISRQLTSVTRKPMLTGRQLAATPSTTSVIRRGLASAHHDDHHHEVPVKLHKEEYLKIARE